MDVNNHREQPDDDINMETYEKADMVCWPVNLYFSEWLAGLSPTQLYFSKIKPLDLHTERSKMEARAKMKEDRTYIMLIASQMHNAGKLQLDFPPAIDEIILAVSSLWKTKTLPFWLVLAMQLLVDIKGVLRTDMSLGFETLRITGTCVTSTLK